MARYFIYDGQHKREIHKAPPGHIAYHSGFTNIIETRFRVKESGFNKEYRRFDMIEGDSIWPILEWPMSKPRSEPQILLSAEGKVLVMRRDFDVSEDRVGFSLYTLAGEQRLTDDNQPWPEQIHLSADSNIVWSAFVATDTHPEVDCGDKTRCEAIFIAGNGPPRQVYNSDGLPSRISNVHRVGDVVFLVDDGHAIAAYDGKMEKLDSLPSGPVFRAYPDRLEYSKNKRVVAVPLNQF